QATVRADVLQAGDVLLHQAAQRALDRVLAIQDAGDAGDLLVAQLLGAALRVDAGLLAQAQSQAGADPVDVAQRDVRRFVGGEVNTQDTRHGPSPSPGAACDGGWCRSRTAARGAGRACSFHKSASRWLALSWPSSPLMPALRKQVETIFLATTGGGRK